MNNCIFCSIANRELPANIVYENDTVIAFHDINPQAPTHILIIPKQHIATLNDISDTVAPTMSEILLAAKSITSSLGIAERGYRLVNNCNAEGGQTVYHLHFHLLAGRAMTWPPG